MSTHKAHAALWLAFSAGMYAEATVNAAKFTDEQIDAEDARALFRVACSEAFDARGVEQDKIDTVFEKGRAFMAELREKGAPIPLPKQEDGPPLEYVGPERQLTPKPDGRLS